LLWDDIGRSSFDNNAILDATPTTKATVQEWRAIACYTTPVRMLWPANTD
jgi:hypothetical protein